MARLSVAVLEVAAGEDDLEAGASLGLGQVRDEGSGDQVLAAADDALGGPVDEVVGSRMVVGAPMVVSGDPPIEGLGVRRDGPVQVADRLDPVLPSEPRLQELPHQRVVAQLRPRTASPTTEQRDAFGGGRQARPIAGSRPVTTSASSGVTTWRIDVRIRNSCRSSERSPTTSSAR